MIIKHTQNVIRQSDKLMSSYLFEHLPLPYVIKRRMAFTLAEVLIALTVIGIVASLTVPSLISSVNDQQLKVAWKKEFSVLNQASLQMMKDTGGTLGSNFTGSTDMKNQYAQYLNVTKTCDAGQSFGNCWHTSWKYGNNATDVDGNYGGIILSDGAMLLLWSLGNCTWSISTPKACGWIKIDVNGVKGPNIDGKDIFAVAIYDNKIQPFGGSLTTWDSPLGFSNSADYLYK